MNALTEFWQGWPLFELPSLAGTLIGATLGALGVYVVLRRLVFLSAATSQAASLGVVLVFFLSTVLGDGAWLPSPLVGAVGLSFAACLLMMGRDRQAGVSRDAVLGGIFLVGAAGTLFLGGFVAQELHDVHTLLLGNAVAVLPEQFAIVAWLMPALLLAQLIWWRGFAQASFGYTDARVRGMPVRAIEVTLFLCLALAISVGTQTIGALPVFALSVLPAVVAVQVAANVPSALLIAAVTGALSGLYGYILGFVAGTPVGPSQVLMSALFALLAVMGAALPAGTVASATQRRGLRWIGTATAGIGIACLLVPLAAAWLPSASGLVAPAGWIAGVAACGAALGGRRGVIGGGLAAFWLIGAATISGRPLLQPILVGFGAVAAARVLWHSGLRMTCK